MQGIEALSWLAVFLATSSAGLLQDRGEIHSAKFQSLQLDVKEVSLVLSHRPVRSCLETSLLLRVSAHEVVVRSNQSEERGELGDFAAWKQAWEEGTTLSFGGVPELLEGTGFPGQGYFQGCVGKIRVQGRELDLDSAHYKHDSIWSHSCPEWTEHSQGDSQSLRWAIAAGSLSPVPVIWKPQTNRRSCPN
ncbi:UNVERIFIED_CONTAM: hypothetical protein FKN15_001471 [Acipenser sinensis]